ncbi:SET domain-containing protein [Mollisia scopiformis]|uniref:SET domain-containing protein n=1 Tax=Mollisia scopiformis TaxID=149040 RepID=A0A194XP99_MOLSC|nr:SET domain-containing protein [Mollisia scopiformis]KUJ21562.1 SET domain-containing protein [Mollisia scopiformis]
MSSPPFTSIPDRATCQASIKVGLSSIKGAGRGVFALEDIPAGGPIFSIQEPLLNIVDDDVQSLSHTCDNCFAAQVDELWTVDNTSIEFKPSWSHHHRYECKTYQEIINNADPAAISMLTKLHLRSIIRILELHKHHQISEEQWAEFLFLSTGRRSKMKKPDFVSLANAVAKIAKSFTMTELSLNKIIDLLCIFHNNQLVIGLPLLRGERSYDPKKYSVISGGIILDPLAAMMNHSCSANTRWYSNGKELRIRARMDIKIGDELTICYDPTEDYTLRRSHLKDYGINCDCPICHFGDTGPTGPFRRKMLHLAHSNLKRKTLDMEDLEIAIEDMRQHQMGYGIYPMRDIHQQAYLAYFSKGKTSECLKLALKIYYQVEPVIKPPIYEDYRLCTLYTIISLLNPPPPGTTNLDELPLVVLMLIPNIFLYLRDKLARDTEKCYGADSIVAKFERNFFVQASDPLKEDMSGSLKYSPLDKSVEGRKELVKSMNELLEWAGMDSLNEKDLT